MKTTPIFTLILFVGLMSSHLFAQTKADYEAKMDAQIGVWLFDKESFTTSSPMDQPMPDIKMTMSKEGDTYKRQVEIKMPDSDWITQTSETYEYDAQIKMLKYSGVDMGQEKFRGQMMLKAEGGMHIIEFNDNNQKTGEYNLTEVSPTQMKVSGKNFIYPESADQDMEIVTFDSTWNKQ